MKNHLFLFISFLIAFSTQAQEISTSNKEILKTDIDRDFFIKKQLDLYTVLPSTLSLWSHSDWSIISFNGSYNEGDFKTTDEFKKDHKFSFKTESVQSYADKSLKLYGSFNFSSAMHEKANWNQFYKKSEIGSPFRIVTERVGDWRTKHYSLNGIITKKISKRIELGLAVNYDGDLYFRTLDTRNEQYNLKINIQTSISYSMGDDKNLSLGIAYNRVKSKPEFRNKFKATGTEYYLYPTIGLGNFDKDVRSESLIIKDQNPSFTLAYHSGNKNKFSVSYTLYPGEEKWENPISSLKEDGSKLYKYDYKKHNLVSSYLINTPKYHLLSKAKVELISGKGYKYNFGYRDAYIYDGVNFKGSFDLLRNNKNIFDQSGIELGFEDVSKKDLTNAHLMEYTNLNVNLHTGFNFALNTSNKVKFTLNGGYKYNLSYTHDLASAAAMNYTINIAHNEMAYHTADYYNVGGKLSWFHQFKSTGIEWALDFNRLSPTDIKISNQYSILEKSTNRTYIGLNFNLIF
ncbi:DUF6850 family outer membrane beta-barrel protein [Ancylomarina sp.]|uniref:DUF6850 family outer membrane beta-barrel protein n=1 Tax=Ancylomarina sp. TaxID=1970196 RepID=UPI003566B3DD